MLDFFIDMRGETASIGAGWETTVWLFFLAFAIVMALATIIVTRVFTRGKKQLRKELAAAEAELQKLTEGIHSFLGGPKPKTPREAIARFETTVASIAAEIDRARTIRAFALGWDTLQPHERVGANGVRVAIATVGGADHWKSVAQDERDELQRKLDAANLKIAEFENDTGEGVSKRKLNKLSKENAALKEANLTLTERLASKTEIVTVHKEHGGQVLDLATAIASRPGNNNNNGGNKKGGNTQQANP